MYNVPPWIYSQPTKRPTYQDAPGLRKECYGCRRQAMKLITTGERVHACLSDECEPQNSQTTFRR